MTIYLQDVQNPGFEDGTVIWTKISGGGTFTTSGGTPHSGLRCGRITGNFIGGTDVAQTVDVSALATAIDTGTAVMRHVVWFAGNGDNGYMRFDCFEADGTTLIESLQTLDFGTTSGYLEKVNFFFIPANTRFIQLVMHEYYGDTNHNQRWDDHVLEISDDYLTDWPYAFAPKAYQLGSYAIGTFPSSQARLTQAPIMALVAAETSNTFHDLKAHQLGAYALVRGKTDRRDLRAWTFTQDDHDFWVLQLGDVGTLVYDKLTDQWAQWRSPGHVYWRGNDGVQWEGWNICCDTETGKLWRIDPEGRLDDGDTPITSVVTGGFSTRMRKNIPCYMAEVAVSEGQPPSGFDDGSVGISLRTSDDQGFNYISHGEVAGGAIGEDMTVRWYGLGTIPAIGRVFEITDTGYARRIDGLNVEVSE